MASSASPLRGSSSRRPPRASRSRRPRSQQFLIGPENRLVEVAIRAVFENPLMNYNPLVLCGPSGTGKSHLARGLEAAWKARRPRCRRSVYTTATDFARELDEAIERQAVDDLRAKYRTVSLLVFEDLGRLADKPAAQTELIHTLDALLAADSRVVVTAAAAPTQLNGIVPALQSRLLGGLVVPLSPPGRDTRLAILRRLAAAAGDPAGRRGGRTAGRWFGRDRSPAGRGAGAVGGPRGGQRRADRRRAGPIVSQPAEPRRRPPLKDIAQHTARHFALTLGELRSSSRRRAVVAARDVAMYLARVVTKQSLEEIGRYFGGRDHTTVMHGCRKTESLLQTDPAIRAGRVEPAGDVEKRDDVRTVDGLSACRTEPCQHPDRPTHIDPKPSPLTPTNRLQ